MTTTESMVEAVSGLQESAGRICVGGGPRSGKTYLSDLLEARGIPVHHTDFLIATHGWSELSAAVAEQMADPGPWVFEGTHLGRALRKRLKAHPGRPCDLLVWMKTPREKLSRGQETMRLGCETVLAEIRPELVRRGVKILEVA